LIPALPIRIRGLALNPDIINALSGGALTYPAATTIIKSTIIAVIMIDVSDIMSSFPDGQCHLTVSFVIQSLSLGHGRINICCSKMEGLIFLKQILIV
jgi:hypothetical protein